MCVSSPLILLNNKIENVNITLKYHNYCLNRWVLDFKCKINWIRNNLLLYIEAAKYTSRSIMVLSPRRTRPPKAAARMSTPHKTRGETGGYRRRPPPPPARPGWCADGARGRIQAVGGRRGRCGRCPGGVERHGRGRWGWVGSGRSRAAVEADRPISSHGRNLWTSNRCLGNHGKGVRLPNSPPMSPDIIRAAL